MRDDADKDTGYANEGFELDSGDTLRATARVPLDSAGDLAIFPCYELAGGGYCPDDWQYQIVSVGA